MSNNPESAIQPATYVLPDGFAAQDLAAPDYVRPLAEAAAPMIDHCQRLLVAIARPDFDGGLELDCTKNNAMTWLDDFFETVARYEEGRVPFAAAAELLALTERLLAAEMRRYPRLRGDIQSIGQAFRRSFALWGRVLPQPRRSRKVYLRKIFASFDKIIDAICTFNSKLFASDAPSESRAPETHQPNGHEASAAPISVSGLILEPPDTTDRASCRQFLHRLYGSVRRDLKASVHTESQAVNYILARAKPGDLYYPDSLLARQLQRDFGWELSTVTTYCKRNAAAPKPRHLKRAARKRSTRRKVRKDLADLVRYGS